MFNRERKFLEVQDRLDGIFAKRKKKKTNIICFIFGHKLVYIDMMGSHARAFIGCGRCKKRLKDA